MFIFDTLGVLSGHLIFNSVLSWLYSLTPHEVISNLHDKHLCELETSYIQEDNMIDNHPGVLRSPIFCKGTVQLQKLHTKTQGSKVIKKEKNRSILSLYQDS